MCNNAVKAFVISNPQSAKYMVKHIEDAEEYENNKVASAPVVWNQEHWVILTVPQKGKYACMKTEYAQRNKSSK